MKYYVIICYSLESSRLFQLQILFRANKVTCLDPGAGYNNNQYLLNIYYVAGIVLTAFCKLPHLFLPGTL